jgi:hypothetical protein
MWAVLSGYVRGLLYDHRHLPLLSHEAGRPKYSSQRVSVKMTDLSAHIDYSFLLPVRGTACGAALALSRMYVPYLLMLFCAVMTPLVDRGGIIAPMAGGILLMMNPSFPVLASALVFALAGFCVLLLPENNGGGIDKGGHAAMIH